MAAKTKTVLIDHCVKVLTGKAEEVPRWEKCVTSTKHTALDHAVGSMYVRQHFNSDAKNVADDIVKNVLEEFKLMILQSQWMDSKTKARALEKAEQITPHIAYAKEILNNKLIDKFYEGINLTKGNFLKNNIQLQKFYATYMVKELRTPINKKSWRARSPAAIVNAFYNPFKNSIDFPAGFLSAPFFKAERPFYMNYGAFGSVVGHEITHGFDDQGSQLDGRGYYLYNNFGQTKREYDFRKLG